MKEKEYIVAFNNVDPSIYDYCIDHTGEAVVLFFPKKYKKLKISLSKKDKMVLDKLIEIRYSLCENSIGYSRMNNDDIVNDAIIKKTFYQIMEAIAERFAYRQRNWQEKNNDIFNDNIITRTHYQVMAAAIKRIFYWREKKQ